MSAAPAKVIERARNIELTPQEVARYSRHLIMPEVALEGQKKLKASSVLLIGAGGLGSPLALYLAAAGVGMGMVGFGVVDSAAATDYSGTADVGQPNFLGSR